MNKVFRILDSTVGQKIIASASGLALIGFVVGHLLGNLTVFMGSDAINLYAEKLQSLGALLWVARIGLVVLVTLHIVITIRLTMRNRRAAGQSNSRVVRQASSASSRNMATSGSIILLFIIFHLLHFTFGVIQPDSAQLTDAEGRHDVYAMIVAGFSNWGLAAFHIVALLLTLSIRVTPSLAVAPSLSVTSSEAAPKSKMRSLAARLSVIGSRPV